MRLLAFILAMVLAVGTATAEEHAHQIDRFALTRNEAIVKCSREHKISEDAIKDIINHIQVNQDEEVKCWVSCLMKNLGIFKEGKIDWARFDEIVTSAVPKENVAKAHQIVQTCRSQVNQDEKNECQLAYSLADCKIKTWNKLGLPTGN
ncbi:general odorant-binding protein 72 [Halyomorpha halys]|uniref:general odorant-binding protein 72 n=1 Tax=Halyomorpha halys TaxID=286706 RepID=UPI0006D4E7B2|nr:uncharacterized protein LOC106681859 [Halyomorpha halys]KAE8573804.1 Odorant-binding protein 41 [Halyomorpha halys]